MRAILIDPFEKSFSEVDAGNVSENFDVAYKLIGTDIIEFVYTPKFTLLVDEEGTFKADQRFFTFIGHPGLLCGKALVVSPTLTDPTVPVEDIRSCVMFVPVMRKDDDV